MLQHSDLADYGKPINSYLNNVYDCLEKKERLQCCSCSLLVCAFRRERLLPVRTLVDPGASHCFASQAYVEQADNPVNPAQNWLKLADNTQAVSNGTCTLALDLQTYSGPIECFMLPLSDHVDLILGDNWCNESGCEISYRDHCLRCDDHDGWHHKLFIQADQHLIQVHSASFRCDMLISEEEHKEAFGRCKAGMHIHGLPVWFQSYLR